MQCILIKMNLHWDLLYVYPVFPMTTMPLKFVFQNDSSPPHITAFSRGYINHISVSQSYMNEHIVSLFTDYNNKLSPNYIRETRLNR